MKKKKRCRDLYSNYFIAGVVPPQEKGIHIGNTKFRIFEATIRSLYPYKQNERKKE